MSETYTRICEEKIVSILGAKQRQRIRGRTKITPWSTPQEFDYVGRCLSHATCMFPTALENESSALMFEDQNVYNELIYGIKRVEIWRLKAENGRLPHSIDVTTSLAQIMLQDYEYQQQKLQEKQKLFIDMTTSLKLSYASIIIRAVNGIADSIQRNRSTYATSVASLCAQIGLPGWVVDIRHDSAHNELPSLVPLRLAAKTLLGFFMQQYWTLLENQRLEWRNTAIELLKECKSTSKAIDRVQMEVMKDENLDADGETEKNDIINNCIDGDRYGYQENYGAYSIFMNTSKKSKKNAEKKEAKATATPKKKVKELVDCRTPRQCINEYFKTVPMDLGIELLLQYLFEGGIGDAPIGRGILIPGSPNTFPETIASVRKILERYSVILISVTNKFPGFLVAAFNRIVDMLISFDESSDEETSNADFGRRRKQYFLKHWFYYLLSNDFYYFLHWQDIMWKGSKNIRQRPREKWSDSLWKFMEGPAELNLFVKARLPLNSVCDRLLLEGCSDVTDEIANKIVEILGDRRVTTLLEMKKEITLKRNRGADLLPTKTTERTDDDINASKNVNSPLKDNESDILDIEEMEKLASAESNDRECNINDEAIVSEEKRRKIDRTWVQCDHWDSCTIGSLPGFV